MTDSNGAAVYALHHGQPSPVALGGVVATCDDAVTNMLALSLVGVLWAAMVLHEAAEVASRTSQVAVRISRSVVPR